MRNKISVFAAATVLVAVLLAVPVHAQQTVARSYSFIPQDGMTAQFEAALKAHIEWRIANGDPWTWGVSSLEVGETVGEFSVRSSGHEWAELDAYDSDFGPKGVQHYMATVAPLVESLSTMITTAEEAMSNRPPAGRPLGFVTITTYHIRPGAQAQFTQAAAAASQALMDHDFPGYWIWETPLSGGGMGPFMRVVSLHDSWSDMQERDPALLEVLAQAMGEDDFEEWMADFTGAIRGQETITRRLRQDLDGR